MNEDKKGGVKDYFQLKELFGYYFRKKQGAAKPDFSLRSMHFVNKFSIIVFILAIFYLIIKHLF
jgi:hypothetical protein